MAHLFFNILLPGPAEEISTPLGPETTSHPNHKTHNVQCSVQMGMKKSFSSITFSDKGICEDELKC
jgi:hypothetical protein